MIEKANTNELQGQLEIEDMLPGNEATGIPEGYDAEGNLLNIDYPPVAEGRATSSDQAATEEVPASPQTPAEDEERLTALATEINAITEQTRGVVISAALAVGKRLIEARSLCQEGRWLEWLSKSVSYSERKAQDMMRLYTEYGRDGSIPDSIAALDYSKAVALLSAPAEAREALAERAADEDLSVRGLQAEIRRLNAEKLKAQMRIEGLEKQIDTDRGHIEQLTAEGNKQDQAIVDRDRQIADFMDQMREYDATWEKQDAELKAYKRELADAAEKVSLANAKAAAAETSANELRRLHSDAEDRAAASAQRASDAVQRANQTAKQLAEAKAKIQALSEAAAAASSNSPEVQTVEVVPEEMQRELEQLKRELAEARALSAAAGTSSAPDGAPDARRLARAFGPPEGKAQGVTAAEKFKWFYQNQMQPTFKTALSLLREVAREDGHAADAFATALTNACRVLMNQLGTKEE